MRHDAPGANRPGILTKSDASQCNSVWHLGTCSKHASKAQGFAVPLFSLFRYSRGDSPHEKHKKYRPTRRIAGNRLSFCACEYPYHMECVCLQLDSKFLFL